MPVVPAADKLTAYTGNAWDQQPRESAKQHRRFLAYLQAPPKERNLTAVAAAENVVPATIWEVAERYRWRERAELYEAHLIAGHLADTAVKERQLSERTMNLALVGSAVLARSMRALADNPRFVLDAKDMPAWAKMIETLRKVALDAPDKVVAITSGAAASVSVPDFTNLSADQITDRAGEMARSVLRLVEGGRGA